MKDERGIYYHPQPGNHHVRVYVRMGEAGEIEFRLWNRDLPEVWEKHGWLPMSVIRQAAALYKSERSPDADPCKLYDEAVARALLREREA